MEFDAFLRRQNIQNYRKLLDTQMTPTQRRIVIKLLVDELDASRLDAATERTGTSRPQNNASVFGSSFAGQPPNRS
jgi:hypothetical protein